MIQFFSILVLCFSLWYLASAEFPMGNVTIFADQHCEEIIFSAQIAFGDNGACTSTKGLPWKFVSALPGLPDGAEYLWYGTVYNSVDWSYLNFYQTSCNDSPPGVVIYKDGPNLCSTWASAGQSLPGSVSIGYLDY
jgi:hypothetical protein